MFIVFSNNKLSFYFLRAAIEHTKKKRFVFVHCEKMLIFDRIAKSNISRTHGNAYSMRFFIALSL